MLSTTSKVDAEVVYQLVKSVFENIERFHACTRPSRT